MEPEAALTTQWRSLLTSYNRVAINLERALHDAHDLTLSEFETLDRLSTQDCGKRRMQELAETMYLSQSALSRTVTRLVKAGLVDRSHCEADRRGIFVQITPAGRQLLQTARQTHHKVLATHLNPQPRPA